MKLTKFEHACLVLEKDGEKLIVDPGNFSPDFITPKKVVGIIISHDHPDHLFQPLIDKILSKNPKATIIAHQSITAKYADVPTQTVTPEKDYQIGPFQLRFFGGTHASINPGIQVPPNLGVLINQTIYYPGDSFDVPTLNDHTQLPYLALPVSAPWLKISECLDLLDACKPSFTFPTHDHILSSDGRSLVDRIVGEHASKQGIVYKRLDGLTIQL